MVLLHLHNNFPVVYCIKIICTQRHLFIDYIGLNVVVTFFQHAPFIAKLKQDLLCLFRTFFVCNRKCLSTGTEFTSDCVFIKVNDTSPLHTPTTKW